MKENEKQDWNGWHIFINKIFNYKVSLPTIVIGLFVLIFLPYLFYLSYEKMETKFSSAQIYDGSLGITTLITSVKNELMEAERLKQNKNEASMFNLQDFDIEIQFVIKSNMNQSGKSDFEFIVVDTNTNIELQKLHKMKLHMKAAPTESTIFKPTTEKIEKTKIKIIDQELKN